MHFEGRKKANQGLNLTPLIDVVFLLLIFFMLTSNFVRDQVIPLTLPTAKSGNALKDELLQVVIDAQGRLLIGEDVVAVDDLTTLLQQELKNRADKRVRIRGDKAVSLGVTVDVLDAARKAGAKGVDIVTREQ